MRLLIALVCAVALTACKTISPAIGVKPWEARAPELQQMSRWEHDGRTAVVVGTQGWQASLDWRQQDVATQVHLAGPLGVGAVLLERTPAGVSMNGSPPSDAVVMQIQERLGFVLPLDEFRYWLVGVPDPLGAFELTRNDQDRAKSLLQGGWTISYERYVSVAGDLLPASLVLTHEEVRVRVIVDHWQWSQ